MVRHKFIAAIGYVFVGLVVAGFVVQVVVAWLKGYAFVGESYWGLPIGTYSTAAVIVAVALIGMVWGGSKLLRALRRRVPKSEPKHSHFGPIDRS